MNKTNQKNKKYTYDPKILDALVLKYGMTKVYIRTCLRGDNQSLTADKVKADYAALKTEFSQTLEKFNQQN
jgi:hypothetical protein